jgi:site-specific recombinase XerD
MEYLNDYLQYLKYECARSKLTQVKYFNELLFLDRIRETLGFKVSFHKLSKIQLRQLIMYCGETLHNTEVTLTRKVNCIQSFFRFLKENDLITENTSEILKSPKLPEKVFEIVSEDDFQDVLLFYETKYALEITKLKHKIEYATDDKKARLENWLKRLEAKEIRNTLLLRFLYSSMIRSGELIKVKVGDLQLDNETLLIRFGKGKKQREVPLDRGTIDLVRYYVQYENLTNNDFLFRNRFNKPFNNAVSIEKQIRVIRKELGLEYSLIPHYFRKCGASHSLLNGAPLKAIQDVLGHASPVTTQIYAKTTISYLKENKKYHPLSKGETKT